MAMQATIKEMDFEGKNAKQRIPYKAAPYRRWKLPGKKKQMSRGRKVLLYLTTAAIFAYLFWRIGFTIPFQYGIPSVVASILLLFAELCSYIIALSNFRETANYLEPALPVIPDEWYPDVDLFVTTHNESVELMYKTINSCTFLTYPDKSKVHVCLCDDNNRPEMKKLAEDMGVDYYGMEGNKHAKAGNMNNAFWQTSGELCVTVDADMILSSDFLMETVPYFFLPQMEQLEDGQWRILAQEEVDPEYKVGFVQSPQSFYNPDLFQYNLYSERNIPNEQDYFFTEVNVAKNHDNASQYAGSNTVLARQALLDIGGFATDSITEDFLTGLMIQQAGYRNLGIPKQLAHGLCPDTIGSLLSQRERWSRGNIQVFRTLKVFTSRVLNFWQKFELTGTACYWLAFIGQMIYMLAPLLSALFNIRVVDAPVWQILGLWLPYYILFTIGTRVLSSNTRTTHWSSVVDTIMAPYLILPTLKEILGIKQKKFVVTNKSRGGEVQQWRKILYTLPHTMLLIATLAAIVVLVRQSLAINSVYNPIVLFWLFMGVKNLLFAIFFMMGRTNYRNAERFNIHAPVRAEIGGTYYSGVSIDASDTGLSVEFNTPLYCRSDEALPLQIQTELYSAAMEVKTANVTQHKGEDGKWTWRYGFVIDSIDEASNRQYMQILYDRPHSLPKHFKENASVFDDINTNVMLRTRKKQVNLRKMARIFVELPFATKDGHQGILHDLNFEYARITFNQVLQPNQTLSLLFGEGLELVLIPKIAGSEGTALYRLLNVAELQQRADFGELMRRWASFENMQPTERPVGSAYIHTIISKIA